MILWTPEQLRERLDDPKLRILDVRRGEAFSQGHVPGARHFSVYGLNVYDTDPAPLKSFVQTWAFLLGRCGIGPDDEVVVYEDRSGMSAARAFWFLEYLGHERVHVLDGGLEAWKQAGFEVATEAELPQPVPYAPKLREDRVAGYQDVLAAIGSEDQLVLDTRSDGEWFGTQAMASRGGTIPGAIHLEWTNHLAADGRFKSADELRDLFASRGIGVDREVIALCQAGYRSAHAYVALRLMGHPRVRNYVGSWGEWGNREGMPVVRPEDPVLAPMA
ncbi:MAG: sulfurtransferase [Planctomycetota bacterium]